MVDDITLQKSLKELYYSLGGDAEKVRDTQDPNAILAEISALNIGKEITEAGENPLPAVTSADEGKVLTVDSSGEWGAEPKNIVEISIFRWSDNESAWEQNRVELIDGVDGIEGNYIAFEELVYDTYRVTVTEKMEKNIAGYSSFSFSSHYDLRKEYLSYDFNAEYFYIYNVDTQRLTYFTKILSAEPFVVTLTPTTADFSGTMDTTPDIIAEAVEAGREIHGFVQGMDSEFVFTQWLKTTENGETLYNLGALIHYNISGQDVLINVVTNRIYATYSTAIFPLTPMS